MTAGVSSPAESYGWEWASLLLAWQELDVPDGWRAEIVGDGIAVTPPPDAEHNFLASRIDRALGRVVPDDWEICHTLGMSIPLRRRLFIPDLVVIPRAELLGRRNTGPVPAEHAQLVVEITSSGNANTDRTEKRWGYAHAPVPLYLLIDRFDDEGPLVTLFSDPEDGHYQQCKRTSFGKPVVLPKPFDLTLDTAEF